MSQVATERRWLSEVATSDAALRQVLHGLPGVDQVGTEARAAALACSTRSSLSRTTAEDDRTASTEATPGGSAEGSESGAGSIWVLNGTRILTRQRLSPLVYRTYARLERCAAGVRRGPTPICHGEHLPRPYSPPYPRFDGRARPALAHLAEFPHTALFARSSLLR